MSDRMPIPKLSRTFELAAALIEHDLHKMRERAQEMYVATKENQGENWDGRVRPQSTSHEADLMKAVEWATAAAQLRLLAKQERERDN